MRRRKPKAHDEREVIITQRALATFFTKAYPEIVSAEHTNEGIICIVKGIPESHEEIQGVKVDEFPRFLVVRREGSDREELVPQVR